MTDGVIGAFSPIASTVGKLTSVLPMSDGPKVTSDQAADVINARDTKDTIADDQKHPLWSRLLHHGVSGAVVGGLGLGAKAGLIAGGMGHATKGSIIGAATGAATGGLAGVGMELFNRATEKRRLGLADKTLAKADPRLLRALNHPDVERAAEGYAGVRGMPASGAEVGALLGSVGGGMLGAYTGDPATRLTRAATGSLVGMAGAGAVGLLAGLVAKHIKRKQLVEMLTRHSMAKAASTWLRTNEPRFQTPTGGSPRAASNRQLLQALAGPPERYAAGRLEDTGSVLERMLAPRRKHAAEGLNKTKFKDCDDGFTAYTVNGEHVRTNLKHTDFIGGSNPEADAYVPAGEYWVEETLSPSDRDFILLHEETERKHMADDGWDYEKAHDAANAAEAKARAASIKTASYRPFARWFTKTAEVKIPKLRSRAEVVIYSEHGVFGIKKEGYLLFPGGGLDDGEMPEAAVIRETIEEADVSLAHLKPMGFSEALFPKERLENAVTHVGSRTYHFLALYGHKVHTEHEDREPFGWIPFDEALEFLETCAKREDQKMYAADNAIRLQSIKEAQTLADAGHLTAVKIAAEKVADQVSLMDRPEYVLFNHEGKIMVGPGENRRYSLPNAGAGTPAPYEGVHRLLPAAGIADKGYQGYNVRLNVGDADEAPGFQGAWEDPHAVLKNLYASMGMPANADYRDLDRGRARVILQALKKRKKAQAAAVSAPVAAPAVAPPAVAPAVA